MHSKKYINIIHIYITIQILKSKYLNYKELTTQTQNI